MKTKESKDIKDKNSKKIKRQVSIITVFLWIFLVATMLTIVIGNIKNTNALEGTQQDQIFGRYIEIYPSKFPSFSFKGKSHSYDSITKKVGEKASFQSMSSTNYLCTRCHEIVMEYIPEQYYGIVPEMSNDGIIGNINYKVGVNSNYPECLEVGFDIMKPGKTTMKLSYSVNYKINSESGYCNYCGQFINIFGDNKWYLDDCTLDIIATVDYNLNYDANAGENEVTSMPDSESENNSSEENYNFKISEEIPKREGYEFLGWAEEKNEKRVRYEAGDDITLKWESGSTVDKTLYAVWKPIAPVREELPNILGEDFVKVHCTTNLNHYDKDKYYSIVDNTAMSGEHEATIGKMYYSEEENAYLCNVELDGNIYCDKYSSEIQDLNHELIMEEDLYKEIVLYYDEYENKWKIFDDTKLPIVFNVKCNIIILEGFYKVKHEYYLKDKNNNMTLEKTLDTEEVKVDYFYGNEIKVGLSNGLDKVNIEVEKVPISTINNVNYIYEYYENSGNVIIERNKLKEITLKYVREEENEANIKVEKIWEDENNKYGKRPENVVLQLKIGEEVVAEMEVSEENNWSSEFVVPKYDKAGNEIKYAVDEKETDVNYEKIVDGYKVINKYIVEEEKNENNKDIIRNEENIGTSDINIWMYVGMVIVSIVVILVVIILVKKSNKKSK